MAGEPFVVWIELAVVRGGFSGLLVGGGEENQFVQFFDAPAIGDELGGQPVEQFRMSGRLAAGAEIAWSRDNAAAEMMLPNAVDQDACG